LHQRILACWADKVDFRLVIWKFEPLGVPTLLTKAIGDAAGADLIIVSLTGNHPLPFEARAWVAGWESKIGKDSALALIVDGEHRQTGDAKAVYNFFRDAAEQSGISFFSSFDTKESEPRMRSSFAGQNVLRTAFRDCDYPDHWGLNE
jgi:hypothetical protein